MSLTAEQMMAQREAAAAADRTDAELIALRTQRDALLAAAKSMETLIAYMTDGEGGVAFMVDCNQVRALSAAIALCGEGQQ